VKLIIKNQPKKKTSRFIKFCLALSIAMGMALVTISLTDNETAIFLSSALSGIATFFTV